MRYPGANFSPAQRLAGGAAAVLSLWPRGKKADAQATHPKGTGNMDEANLANPVVPNFDGEYGSQTAGFTCPKRAMGSTGLAVFHPWHGRLSSGNRQDPGRGQ